jgi:DNA-binding CsgD family transcriptional regulator
VEGKGKIWVVCGSACTWAWGYLVYLSTVLFPDTATNASVGLEYGYFASQAAMVLAAAFIIARARTQTWSIRKGAVFGAACALMVTTLVLTWSIERGLIAVIVVCGVIDGVAGMMMGVVWGTQYSLGSKQMRLLVVLSFLGAYLLYLVLASQHGAWVVAVVSLLPMVSWALWVVGARERSEKAVEVFPIRRTDGSLESPGELAAGSWEAEALPWRSLGVIIALAFVGNMISSAMMGFDYEHASVLYTGGVIVCTLLVCVSLIPSVARARRVSLSLVYRTTVVASACGLVSILVFGAAGIDIGCALLQGGACFLQVLVLLVVTQTTQDEGLSPLLSFSLGQGLIAAVVLVGNLVGKVLVLCGMDAFMLDVLCGLGIVVLMVMMTLTFEDGPTASSPTAGAVAGGASGEGPVVRGIPPTGAELAVHGSASVGEERPGRGLDAGEGGGEVADQARIDAIVEKYGLTKREAEVFRYLAHGRSLPYIAEELFVTTGTVKTHTMHIYRKLGIGSRQELIDLYEHCAV